MTMHSRFIVGCALLLGGQFGTTPLFAADLLIDIEGVRSELGTLRIALHDSAAAFEKFDQAHSVAAVQIRANLNSIAIKGLPAGKYAVAVYHDENQDGMFNEGLLFAEEGYGFSNGASCWKRPHFTASAFELSDTMPVHILMKYC